MLVDILTLFPDMFHGVLGDSILRIAVEKGLFEYRLHNIRDYTLDKHGKVDDRPYGGGPGMVLCCEPVVRCIEAVRDMDEREPTVIMLTPQGTTFTQSVAQEFSRKKRLILVCGHYEGFDERLRAILHPLEVSIGDYVLTGGEIPAMTVIDAVVRLIPGVLGHEDAAGMDSFTNGLLEYPQYSRPPVFRGHEVPEVLLSGNYQLIEKWRSEQALKRTSERRGDLLENKTSD